MRQRAQPQTKREIQWGVVGAGDLGAGVGIAIVASPILCVPFIGWGAYLGGTAAGAAITSAGAAIIYVTNDTVSPTITPAPVTAPNTVTLPNQLYKIP